MHFSAAELQALLKPITVEGESTHDLTAIASLASAGAGDLSFLTTPRFAARLAQTRASVVLVPHAVRETPSPGQAFFYFADPNAALIRLCAHLAKDLYPAPAPGRHPTAVIADTARIGYGASIGPFAVIEDGVTIGSGARIDAHTHIGHDCTLGRDCVLNPRVTLYPHCALGDRVILHSGVVLGSEGFGYTASEAMPEKIPQIGRVIVEDDVEIGANTTIDRARFACTRIGRGTKIDNLVQIAHNVEIGPQCLIVAQAGIAGSTRIGAGSIIAGQAGVTGHLELGEKTTVGAQAGLHYNTAPGSYHRSSPALPAALANRVDVLRKRLPEVFRRLDALEKLSR